jgi:hypothetical protein
VRQIRNVKKPWENPEPLGHPAEGWSVVRVQTPWDYGLETYFLDHCLGTKHFETFERGHRVFSLRDQYDVPHATILALKPNIVSPYMGFTDLGTMQVGNVGGEILRILQVRGRHDSPARVEYLRMVRNWFMECVGHKYEGADQRIVDMHNLVFGDSDTQYHDAYLLDEDERGYPGAWVGDPPAAMQGWLSL